jgi:hypothetical protein
MGLVGVPLPVLAESPLPREAIGDGDFKRLIETASDAEYQAKGLVLSKGAVLKGQMPGNATRAWYPVVRLYTRRRSSTYDEDPDDSFVSCAVQIIIDWILGGCVPIWLLRGFGFVPDVGFRARMLAAFALMHPAEVMRAIQRRIGDGNEHQ